MLAINMDFLQADPFASRQSDRRRMRMLATKKTSARAPEVFKRTRRLGAVEQSGVVLRLVVLVR
jgi:hypothetical protein